MILRYTMVLILLTVVSASYAQPGGGGIGGGTGTGGPPPVGAPIDGGAVAFLTCVVGYVYTQLKDKVIS